MDEIEGIDDQPQQPIDVARRALILSGVVCRASLETYRDEEYKQETAAAIHDWFDELDLWPYLEPCEEKIISARFGTLSESMRTQGTWFIEGLAMLAWALRRGEFPYHDQKVDPIAVTNALDFLDSSAGALLESPSLRDLTELMAAREWFYDVHCTLRGFLNHGGNGRLATWIGEYLLTLGLDPKEVMYEEFLTVDGKPVIHAGRERLQKWEHVICERHRATIWMLGEDPLYTELSVDT